MRKTVILICLSVISAGNILAQGTDGVRILPDYSPGHEQVKKADDPPTLIISIAGIGSYEPGASGEQMFNQVQNMFGTKEKNYDVSTINIYDITRQGGPKMTPESQQWEANKLIKGATQTRNRIIRFQTQIPGIDDLVKANIKNFTPSVPLDNISSLARRLTDTVINAPESSSFKTRWEEETRRGAISVEAAIRKFKAENPNARVILVGHSAGTDLIPLIPTVDKVTGKRLVDLRVLSSPRAQTLSNAPDPEHTVFVTHTSDLPASPFGKLDDPRAKGQLERQGVVLEMHGGLSTNIPGFAQIEAHNKTFKYDNDVKMLIKTPAGNVDFTGKPGDIIRKVLDINSRPIIEGVDAPDQLKRKLDVEKSKASRVGGVTFSKPAEVPIDPNDIKELQFEYPFDIIVPEIAGHSGYGFSFLMKSGEKISLPSIDPATAAEAFICVYRGFVPEVDYTFIADTDGTLWKKVNYKNCQEYLPFTRLGDTLIEADSQVTEMAIGYGNYTKPKFIKNYHNYNELSFDNKLTKGDNPKQDGIIWIEPSVIRTELFGDRLEYERIRMAFHFLVYDVSRRSEFYAEKYNGYSDPAGDFLANQMTNNFEDFSIFYPETVLIKETAGFTGVLLWAYNNNIHVSQSTWDAALRTWGIDRNIIMQSKNPILKARQDLKGNIIFLYKNPLGKTRETDFNKISRPAPIFDQWGLSRLLWEDGSESKIEHNDDKNGRIESLIGRQKEITRILYNNSDGRPVAIVDSKGNGVAVIWTDKMPILCRQVTVDLNSRKVIFNRHTQYDMVDDIEEVFGDMFATWLKAQKANQPTKAWLGGVTPWYDLYKKEMLFGLTVALLLAFAIRRFTATGSLKMSWALLRLGYGRGYEIPRRAAETLGKSKSPRVASALVKKIKNKDATLYAFDALRMMGVPAMEPLISLLKDNDVNVRINAAETLGKIGDPGAVEPLRVFISEEKKNSSAWCEAVEALGDIGDARCVEILIAMLSDELRYSGEMNIVKDTRIIVIDALSKTHNPAAVEPIIKALGHQQSSVRKSAVDALGAIGDKRAVPSLVPLALNDEDIEVRKETAKVLNTLGWRPEDVQTKVNLAFALQNWDELVKLGSPAVTPLIGALLQGKEYELRRKAAETLGKIGDARAVESLVEALKEWSLREAAADALGEIKDSRAVGPLVAVLSDDNFMQTILMAMVQIGISAATPLTDALKHKKPRVRAAIAIRLGRLGGAGIEGLRMAIEDPDADVQQAAVSALGYNEDPQSVVLLDEILHKGSDNRLRQKAVQALGLKALATTPSGAPKDLDINALGPLVEALGDKDSSVREEAEKVLYSWVSKVYEPAQRRPEPSNETERRLITLAGLTVHLLNLFKNPSTPVPELTDAIRQLGIIGDRHAVGYLTLLLDNGNEAVRFEAAETLKMLGHAVDIKAIEAVRVERLNKKRVLEAELLAERVKQIFLKLNSGDWEQCYRAATQLSRINDPRALESLKEALKGENAIMRQAVVVALGEAGDKRAVEALIEAKNDNDRDVRFAANKALEKLGYKGEIKPSAASSDASRTNMRSSKDGESDRWVVELIAKLKNGDTSIAIALSHIADPEAFEALMDALKGGNTLMRKTVAVALGETKKKQGIAPLIKALNDNEPDVSAAASASLVNMGQYAVEALVIALKDGKDEVRKAAANVLVKIKNWDPDICNALTEEMKGENADERKMVIDTLARLETIPANDRVVVEMMTAVMEVNDSHSIEVLTASLKHDDKRVRKAAARVLGRIKGQQALELLTAALQENKENDVCSEVIRALSGFKDSRVYGLLITKLDGSDLQPVVLKALGEIKDPQAIGLLIKALDDKLSYRRDIVSAALINMGMDAVEPLVIALKDSKFEVRTAAANALFKIGIEASLISKVLTEKMKGESTSVREEAIERLALVESSRYPKERVIELITGVLAVDDSFSMGLITNVLKSYSEKQKAAVRALSRIKNTQSLELLIALLNDRLFHEHAEVINSLSKFRDPRIYEQLKKTLEDEYTPNDVIIAAVRALGEIGDQRAIGLLKKFVKSGGNQSHTRAFYISGFAAEALEKLGAGPAVGSDNKLVLPENLSLAAQWKLEGRSDEWIALEIAGLECIDSLNLGEYLKFFVQHLKYFKVGHFDRLVATVMMWVRTTFIYFAGRINKLSAELAMEAAKKAQVEFHAKWNLGEIGMIDIGIDRIVSGEEL